MTFICGSKDVVVGKIEEKKKNIGNTSYVDGYRTIIIIYKYWGKWTKKRRSKKWKMNWNACHIGRIGVSGIKLKKKKLNDTVALMGDDISLSARALNAILILLLLFINILKLNWEDHQLELVSIDEWSIVAIYHR